MAKKGSGVSKASAGGRQKKNLAHEEVRQARFARRKEADKEYQWKPNPYQKGSDAWYTEECERAEKNVDRRLPYARWTSILRKLDNELAYKERLAKNKRKVS